MQHLPAIYVICAAIISTTFVLATPAMAGENNAQAPQSTPSSPPQIGTGGFQGFTIVTPPEQAQAPQSTPPSPTPDERFDAVLPQIATPSEQVQAPQSTTPPGAAPIGLPQTPTVAAALIMSTVAAEPDPRGVFPQMLTLFYYKLEIIDDDHIRFRSKGTLDNEIHFARVNNCQFRVANYSTGFVAELNFRNLSSGYSIQSGNIVILEGAPSSLSSTRRQDAALCKGYMPQSQISRFATDDYGVGTCYHDVPLYVPDTPYAPDLNRLIRALVFVSQSCPLATAPF